MPVLLVLAIVIGAILLFTGIFVAAVKFLLFIGIVLIVLALIGWLLRSFRGRSRA